MDGSGTLTADSLDRLLEARQRYAEEVSPHYDEVLAEVSECINESGSIGKSDIGAILFWKRLRADTPWLRDLMGLPDSHIRSVTHKAVKTVRDDRKTAPDAAGAGRASLSPLRGFHRGDALASALLLAADPGRMAVYDRRAQKGIQALGLSLTSARGRYRRYMAIVEQLRLEAHAAGADGWRNRDVDLALYWLGGS